jgi:hypothetical protein
MYDALPVEGDSAEAEWIEIYNAGETPVDLAGWTLLDGAGRDVLLSLVVPARGYAIVAATEGFRVQYPAYDGPLMVLGGRIGNGLGNDGDAVYLLDANGAVVDAVSWGDNAFALRPAVEDAPEGHSIERRVPGADTDAASDWIDNERPSPGAAYSAPDGGSFAPTSPVEVIEGANAGAWSWVPWALAAGSIAALATTLAWRSIEALRQRTREQP